MNLTHEYIQNLLNEKNKEIYGTVYDLVVKEYENILESLVPDEDKIKSLGTCGIYLTSITELLHTTNNLLKSGYIESGGCLATALWERFITLRMILINPEGNSQIHVEHQKLKKTPWKIAEMVKAVIENEHKKKPKKKKETENKLLYLQYTFFCAIKHGNPYTISYLNRPDRSSNKQLFTIKPNDSFDDRDLKYYFLWLLMEIALDTLADFCLYYSKEYKIKSIQELLRFLSEITKANPLEVPKIILALPGEFEEDFWKVLQQLEDNR